MNGQFKKTVLNPLSKHKTISIKLTNSGHNSKSKQRINTLHHRLRENSSTYLNIWKTERPAFNHSFKQISEILFLLMFESPFFIRTATKVKRRVHE